MRTCATKNDADDAPDALDAIRDLIIAADAQEELLLQLWRSMNVAHSPDGLRNMCCSSLATTVAEVS